MKNDDLTSLLEKTSLTFLFISIILYINKIIIYGNVKWVYIMNIGVKITSSLFKYSFTILKTIENLLKDPQLNPLTLFYIIFILTSIICLLYMIKKINLN